MGFERKGISILNKKGQAIILLENPYFEFEITTEMEAIPPGTIINGTIMNVEEGPLVISTAPELAEWNKFKESEQVKMSDANILSVGFQAIAGPAAPNFSWSIDLVAYNRGDDAGKTFLYATHNTFDWLSGGYGGGLGLSMGVLSMKGHSMPEPLPVMAGY